MALPPLATVDDLSTRLGQPIVDEPQAEALLVYASTLVRAFAGRNWINPDGELDGVPDEIPPVVVEVVFRAVTNHLGVTQEATGPFSVSFGPDAAQRLYLNASDKAIIRHAIARPQVWTLATTRGDLETQRVVGVEGSAKPIPADMPW